MIVLRSLLFFAALIGAMPALAHITLENREAAVGTFYKAVFRVGHGCGVSPTVKLRVRIPDGVITVRPMPKPGWQVETTTAPYGKSYSVMHGAPVTEGVKEVTWTGNLPDKFYDEFVLNSFLSPDLAAGTTIYFPVVQECENGVHRWIEIPAQGKSGEHLKEPAPGVKLVPRR